MGCRSDIKGEGCVHMGRGCTCFREKENDETAVQPPNLPLTLKKNAI